MTLQPRQVMVHMGDQGERLCFSGAGDGWSPDIIGILGGNPRMPTPTGNPGLNKASFF